MISLAGRLDAGGPVCERPPITEAEFVFALGCPVSYLVAERIERHVGEAVWVPVPLPAGSARERLAFAAALAKSARLPLVEPEGYPGVLREATRVAAWASAQGLGREFGLAALRLAFCGGYDLGDPDVIAAAAAAVGLDMSGLGEAGFDGSAQLSTRRRAKAGITSLPAVRIGSRWFHGLDVLAGDADFRSASAQLRATFPA